MIELIFSDSGAAALALAKRTGDKSSLCGMVITTDGDGNETEEIFVPKPYTGPTIDGDVSDIAALWMVGDVGDISNLSCWRSRLHILRDISRTHEMETNEWVEEECQRAQTLVQRLEKAAMDGEAVRIWWSDIPHEMCGYYWAMSILKDAAGPVTSIKVPRLWRVIDGFSSTNGTGDLDPEELYSLLSLERAIVRDERHAVAQRWKFLVSENAPLRVVINGKICSVPESFYDYILEAVLPEEEIKVIEVIGRALAKGPGGVYDWWYANRIRHFLKIGELVMVAEGPKFYYSIIRKK